MPAARCHNLTVASPLECASLLALCRSELARGVATENVYWESGTNMVQPVFLVLLRETPRAIVKHDGVPPNLASRVWVP